MIKITCRECSQVHYAVTNPTIMQKARLREFVLVHTQEAITLHGDQTYEKEYKFFEAEFV